jgi:SAM-dependent methyltransferase
MGGVAAACRSSPTSRFSAEFVLLSPGRRGGGGTGENALFFASRGHKVTGIDFLEEPIQRAKRKATERGLSATFLVMDGLALKDLPEVFDSVIDSGLFHVYSDEDRQRYVEGLASVWRPGGRLFLLCFSDEEPGRKDRGGCRRKAEACGEGGRERRSANGRPRRNGPRLSPFSFGHSLALGLGRDDQGSRPWQPPATPLPVGTAFLASNPASGTSLTQPPPFTG